MAMNGILHFKVVIASVPFSWAGKEDEAGHELVNLVHRAEPWECSNLRDR